MDASEAGAGNLEVIVRCAKNGQRIPNFLEASDRSGKFRIFFTPKKRCHRYKVDVTFNEDQVAGRNFTINIYCVLGGENRVLNIIYSEFIYKMRHHIDNLLQSGWGKRLGPSFSCHT